MKNNHKPRKTIIISIIIIIAFILLPILINVFVLKKAITIDSTQWFSFCSVYYGTLAGALISLIGIWISIYFSHEQSSKDREFEKEQNKKVRESSIRPYCIISFSDFLPRINKHIGFLMVGCEPRTNPESRTDCVIYIKNIGLGAAVEFEITNDPIEDGRDHYPVLLQHTPEMMNNHVSHLQPGEEAYIGITFFFHFNPIIEKDLIKYTDDNDPMGFDYILKQEEANRYKSFDIVLNIKYKDLVGNEFLQKAVLRVSMHWSINKETRDGIRGCNFYLKEATLPKRMN